MPSLNDARKLPGDGSREGVPGPFKQGKARSLKPDRRGKVAVRIFLVNEQAAELMPVNGNLREDIFIEDATVGEVAEHLKRLLFGQE